MRTAPGVGLGSLRSWQAFQEARKKYPGAKRFSINYSGPQPKITPHYTSSATSTTRRARAGSTQQDRIAARLAEIQQEDLGPTASGDRSHTLTDRPGTGFNLQAQVVLAVVHGLESLAHLGGILQQRSQSPQSRKSSRCW